MGRARKEPDEQPTEAVADAPEVAEEQPVAEAEQPSAEAAGPEVAAEDQPASEEKPKRTRAAAKPKVEKPKVEKKPAAKAPAKKPAERKPIVRGPAAARERGKLKERRGIVVSAAMEKTIVVRVDSARPHPRYKKVVRRSTKLHAHDERNEAKAGDFVRIVETRPLSKTKSWRLAEILEAAK